MPFIKINNINFNYEFLGGKSKKFPPVVFIGGYACDINLWRPIAEKIAAYTRALIFDNQGIGQTTEEKERPLTLDDMAKNIKKLIDALSLYKPIVTSFAIGGVIAQKLAHDNPNWMTKLILLNTVIKFNSEAASYCEDLCKYRAKDDLNAYSDLLYETAFSSEFKKENSKIDFRNFFVPLLNDVQTAIGQRRQVEVLKACDSSAWASKIRAPTAIIASEHDIFATPEESKTLAHEIGKTGTKITCYLIEKSGHATINEKFNELFSIIEREVKMKTCTSISQGQKLK